MWARDERELEDLALHTRGRVPRVAHAEPHVGDGPARLDSELHVERFRRRFAALRGAANADDDCLEHTLFGSRERARRLEDGFVRVRRRGGGGGKRPRRGRGGRRGGRWRGRGADGDGDGDRRSFSRWRRSTLGRGGAGDHGGRVRGRGRAPEQADGHQGDRGPHERVWMRGSRALCSVAHAFERDRSAAPAPTRWSESARSVRTCAGAAFAISRFSVAFITSS